MKRPVPTRLAELVSTKEATRRNKNRGLAVGRKIRGFGFKPHSGRANPKYSDAQRAEDATKLFIAKCAEAATKGKLRTLDPRPSKLLRRKILNAGGNIKWLSIDDGRRNNFVDQYFRILTEALPKVRRKGLTAVHTRAGDRSSERKIVSQMEADRLRNRGQKSSAVSSFMRTDERSKKGRTAKVKARAGTSMDSKSSGRQSREAKRAQRWQARKRGVTQEWNWVIAQTTAATKAR